MIKIKHNNETYVEESDLWMICQCIDSLVYLLNELEEDYFVINPDDKEQHFKIIYDYPRTRAKLFIISKFVHDIDDYLRDNGITFYEDQKPSNKGC